MWRSIRRLILLPKRRPRRSALELLGDDGLLPRVPAAKCTQISRTPDVDNAVPIPSFTVTKMSWSEEYMGELTSQNLWSQYVRRFVGIT